MPVHPEIGIILNYKWQNQILLILITERKYTHRHTQKQAQIHTPALSYTHNSKIEFYGLRKHFSKISIA